jgi:hypothetical protein
MNKTANEQAFLLKVGMENLSMEEFIKIAEQESQSFREGLKTAMLEEGVSAATVEGLFKEAEEILSQYLQELEKNAGLGGLLASTLNKTFRGLKQPLLEGVAQTRGFMPGPTSLLGAERGVNQMIRKVAPGLPTTGEALGEVHRGGLRMGLGNLIAEKTPFTGLGNRLQLSGEKAMGRQATRVNDRIFREKYNTNAQQFAQDSRRASGPNATTQKAMEQAAKAKPSARNDMAGAVPAKSITQASRAAQKTLANPTRAAGIGAASGGRLRGAMGGALTGGALLGPAGFVGGGLMGSGLASGGTLSTLAGGAILGNKLLGGVGTPKPPAPELTDGLPADRNRVIPFARNNWAGGIGGALLASMLGREMGLSGPLSWILPLLGGVAGYKMLPGMINNWKDPRGFGANAIPQVQRPANVENFGYATRS